MSRDRQTDKNDATDKDTYQDGVQVKTVRGTEGQICRDSEIERQVETQ